MTMMECENHHARRRWLFRAAAFALTLMAGLLYRFPQPVDWDSWDYLAQAIAGQRSDLLLGRWWFIAAMNAVWHAASAAGFDRMAAFVAMQFTCAAFMAAAVVMGMAWTARLTRSATAEILFAAIVLVGPVVGIYTYSVMTEGLTLLALSTSFWAWQRSCQDAQSRRQAAPQTAQSLAMSKTWALLAGLAFGIAVDVREPVILLAAWPVASCLIERPRRSVWQMALFAGGVAVSLGAGVIGAWAWAPPWGGGYFAGIAQYIADMGAESQRFPLSIAENLKFLFVYSAAAVPAAAVLAVPAAIWAVARRQRRLWALAAACVPLAAAMLANHDLPINVRHCLPLAWMLAPLAAAALDAWVVHRGTSAESAQKKPMMRAMMTACVLLLGGAAVVAAGWGTLQVVYFSYAGSQSRSCQAMLALPADAAVIAGPSTPVAQNLNRLGVKRFDLISSGWDWPPDIASQIEQRVEAGKVVYVFVDTPEWQRVDRTARQWEQLRTVLDAWGMEPSVGPFARLAPRR